MPALRQDLRLLLVEDNSISQQVALRMLKKLCLKADLAKDGFEGVDAALSKPYDVIFMDLSMPGMPGLEATKKILCHFSHTPPPYIIAMTANALSSDRELCLSSGMDDFISKPFTINDIREALERYQASSVSPTS